MAECTCPNCVVLERRVAELEALVAKLLQQVEVLQRGNKRQAAPFSNGPPKDQPKTPGRKSGAEHGKHGHRPPLHRTRSTSATKRRCRKPVPSAAARSANSASCTNIRPKSRVSRYCADSTFIWV